MSIHLSCIRIAALIGAFLLIGFNSYGQDGLGRAEAVAKTYMTAFLRGEFETAAKLTHPDTLATLKQSFLIQLDQARIEGRQEQMLEEVGIKQDVQRLRAMNPQDFYVTIVKSNQKRGDSEAFKSMRKTQVEVVSSELLTANEAAVRLRIRMPGEDGVSKRAGGLILRKYKENWRVGTNLE
jgi:hypothetical protein